MGRAKLIDISNGINNKRYDLKDMGDEISKLHIDDILIIQVGSTKTLKGREKLFKDYPVPNENLIDFLISRKIKCFGTDVISVDEVHSKIMPNHRRLLNNGIIIIEGLFNLESLKINEFFLWRFH